MMDNTAWGLLLGTLITLAVGNAQADGNGDKRPFLVLEEIRTPAAAGSSAPNLSVAADGQVYLSWQESLGGERYALRFAVLEAAGWSRPGTVSQGADWLVNWADFPSLTPLPDERLAAHWLSMNGDDWYAYDVNIAYSVDGGTTWGRAITPHRDATQTQHGFVSLLSWQDTDLLAVWLDGRLMTEPNSDIMTLRAAVLDEAGRLTEETVLDDNVCTCCQTAAVATADGALVAYRDRSADEIRDIALVRFQDGHWTQPRTLHEDGWRMAGCPVNGPALAADGRRVAVVWFTAAEDKARVQLAFSDDGGASFAEPVQVDDGDPLGRVDVVLLADGAALVSWLELGPRGAEFRFRPVRTDGSAGPSIPLAKTDSGFPKMVRSDDSVYFAWTQSSSPPLIRTAVLKLGDYTSSQ